MPPDGTSSLLPPPDTLDDEEALARLHEAEPARLADESCIDRRVRELALEPLPLAAEARHLPGARGERMSRVDVRAQGPVVEKPDQAERADAVRPLKVGTRIAAAWSTSARSQAPFDIAWPTVGRSSASGSWCR